MFYEEQPGGCFVWENQGQPVIIMQWTGLYDQNSKDVFEGDIIRADIVEYSVPTIGQVVFSSEYLAWASRNLAGDTLLYKLCKIEIIGNIFENFDLLEKLQIAE